jgi:hypothetical protein
MWFSYRTDDMLKYMFWVVSSMLKIMPMILLQIELCVWSVVWIVISVFDCLLQLGIKCMYLMPAAVEN